MNRWIKISCLIAAIFISVSCTLPAFFSQESSGEEPQKVESSPIPEEPTEPELTPSPEVLDCGLDLECFNGAVVSCQKSTYNFQQQIDFAGTEILNSLLIQIVGNEEENCVFTLKTDEILVSISEEAVEQLLESGMSEEDIETQRLTIEQAQVDAGFDDTCRGNRDDLISMLLRWEEGKFSMEDWDPFSCEGKIFAAAELVILPTSTEEVPQPTEELPPVAGNLLANDSFENNPESTDPHWEIETRNTNVVAKWTSEQSKIGEFSLLLSATEPANQGFPGWFTVEPIQISQGEWHIFQVWAMSPDGADAFITAEFRDDSGTHFNNQTSGCVDLEPNIWKAVSFGILAETTADVGSIRLGLQQCLTNTTGTLTHLYYDEIYFGTTPP